MLMKFFADAAAAAPAASGAGNAAQPNAGGGMFGMMIPLILVLAVMMIFTSRSQKKQARKRQEMLDKIAKGSKVLMISGIYGTVVEVHEKDLVVEIADRVRIRVVRNGIADVEDGDGTGLDPQKLENGGQN